MKLIQYHGPFAGNETFSVEANNKYRYTHIGIEIPEPNQMRDKVLIPEIEMGSANQAGENAVGSRYNYEFKMNKNGILEFDGLASLNYFITIKQPLPMEATIEIAYRNIED